MAHAAEQHHPGVRESCGMNICLHLVGYYSLQHTDVNVNTAIYQSSCVFVFGLSHAFLGEKATALKLGSLLLCISGVAIISAQTSQLDPGTHTDGAYLSHPTSASDQQVAHDHTPPPNIPLEGGGGPSHASNSALGIAAVLASAFFYALYEVLYAVMVPLRSVPCHADVGRLPLVRARVAAKGPGERGVGNVDRGMESEGEVRRLLQKKRHAASALVFEEEQQPLMLPASDTGPCEMVADDATGRTSACSNDEGSCLCSMDNNEDRGDGGAHAPKGLAPGQYGALECDRMQQSPQNGQEKRLVYDTSRGPCEHDTGTCHKVAVGHPAVTEACSPAPALSPRTPRKNSGHDAMLETADHVDSAVIIPAGAAAPTDANRNRGFGISQDTEGGTAQGTPSRQQGPWLPLSVPPGADARADGHAWEKDSPGSDSKHRHRCAMCMLAHGAGGAAHPASRDITLHQLLLGSFLYVGVVGAATVLLWGLPLLPLHYARWEVLCWPDAVEMKVIVANSLMEIGYCVFLVVGIIISSPLFISIGVILAIPASMVVDVLAHGATITASSIVGSIMIAVGFVSLNFAMVHQSGQSTRHDGV
eukprot:jgi/Mesvir1/28026/Mv04634-RA.1